MFFSLFYMTVNNNNNNKTVRPLLTYHVQVFRLSMNNNSIIPIIKTLANDKINEKIANNNYDNDTPNNNDHYDGAIDGDDDEHFEQYSHQKSEPKKLKNPTIMNQPETKKQIASIHGGSSSHGESRTEITSTTKTTMTNEPLPIMETLNFTNPLFIITNLTSSTSYLLRIWSSKQHMDDSMIEQVNITVRTKPDDDEFDQNHHHHQQHGDRSKMDQKSVKIFDNLLSFISFGHKDLFIILVMIILFIFIIITLTYSIRFARKVHHHSHGKGNYNNNLFIVSV